MSSHAAAHFTDRLREAFPDAPRRLTDDYEAEQVGALSDWLRRVRDVRRRYGEGLIDRSELPPRVRARGAAYHLTELKTHEAEAIFLVMTAAAPLIAETAERAGGDTAELLSDAHEAVTRSLCGWKQQASLASWLSRDLPECFRRIRARHEDSHDSSPRVQADPFIESRVDISTDVHDWRYEVTVDQAAPVRWAKSLTRPSERLTKVFCEHLSPEVDL